MDEGPPLLKRPVPDRKGVGVAILAPNEVAPALELEDIEGVSRSLRGIGESPAIVAFFSLDCRACDLSYLFWDRMAEAYADLGSPLLAISLDSREGAAEFYERSGVSFPVLVDERREVAKAFGLECTPSLFLIDGDGIVLASHDAFDREALNALSTLVADAVDVAPVLLEAGESPDFMPGCTLHL